jgi:hypothetical protein
MDNRIYNFMAKIKKVPDIDGAYIEFSHDSRKDIRENK